MRWIAILALTITATVPLARGETKPEVAADEKLLDEAGLKHDGPALLDFFRMRTGKDDDLEKVARLVPKLGDDDFEVRRQAFDDLKRLTPAEATAGTLRRLGPTHPDEEVRDGCRILFERIEKKSPSRLAAAAARLVLEKKPAGAVAVLLAYLPFAQDDFVEDEVLTSLTLLALKDGKADPAFAVALKDGLPIRRATAAMLLGRSGSATDKKAVTALLTDKDPLIRLRAAQGLIAGHEKEALAPLIALLGEGTLEQATQAEDLLACLAAGRGPRVLLGESNASRKKCQDAWAAWWKAAEGRFDLAKAEADLSPFNATLRLRETIRRFLIALNRGDFPTLSRLTDPPFRVLGQQLLNSREDTDNYWAGMMAAFRQQNVIVGAGSLVTLDDYLRTAPPAEKEMLAALPKTEIRLLYVNTYLNGQIQPQYAQWHALLFRVNGARVRVIGVGQGMKQ